MFRHFFILDQDISGNTLRNESSRHWSKTEHSGGIAATTATQFHMNKCSKGEAPHRRYETYGMINYRYKYRNRDQDSVHMYRKSCRMIVFCPEQLIDNRNTADTGDITVNTN